MNVDVIIPVYGAADDLRRCLESVFAEPRRVLLVVDGPQDAAVESAIATYPRARVLRNERRRGFVASANRGMRESAGDVVLLNSDTVVTPRWLEKMVEAAASNADIGTVTPLSNHATLVSVPRGFEENLLPGGYDATSFGALVERVSARDYPRLPTAVGVCMYIRRALLDAIGYFDEQNFGLGYGEENDFCMRATKSGWLHIADDATFIYHAGHRSFAASRKQLQRKAAATLQRLHPDYMKLIANFMKTDPLTEVRARILQSLGQRAASDGQRIVHLVHGFPPFQHAGTELYAHWLVEQQRGKHHVAVYTRSADPRRADGEALELVDQGVRVRMIVNNFTARNPLRRNALRNFKLEMDFERFLKSERPDLLHVHHLAGHAFSLMRVARRLRIPIVLQIQDWWFLCARVNLYHRDGVRCSGPAPEKCARCATLTKVPPASITNRLVHAIRRREARAAIRAADAYVAGSHAIRDDYAAIVSPNKPFHVIPYGVAIDPPRATRPAARQPIRFGYVGSIAPHKGVHTAVEAMRGINAATLHLWGDATALPDYVAQLRAPNVVFEGRFPENEKERVYASMDVLLVPSIGLESFGLA
ncbi:MAG TPA: glycosyltransferase, partial [Thermoanaerobaculia bacterium]|nr:glycosyltransferase [Thermoanaerobaculia bacterium]